MFFRLFLFGFLLLKLVCAFAQTDNDIVNQYIEQYIENTGDEIDIQQFASELLYYVNHPIPINTATASELFQAPFFSGFQAIEIIQHRNTYGNFISIYELQVLQTFSLNDISRLQVFIKIKPTFTSFRLNDIWQKGEHQIMTLAETTSPQKMGFKIKNAGLDTNIKHFYSGANIYSNFRYRFDYERHLGFGLNAENDAGEDFFKKSNSRGFDYYSFYLTCNNIGKIKSFNLGDFQANFGQGLTLSTGLAFGKSSIITNAKRNFSGFGAYRSLRENAYLRGGALAFELKRIDVGFFMSSKKVDGNAVFSNDSSVSEPAYLTSMQEEGGLHRTQSEISDERIQQDLQMGIYMEYKSSWGKIGTINYARKLDYPLVNNNAPYNAFSFTGDHYKKSGVYYDLVIKNFNLFGESSYCTFNSSFAHAHGALFSLGKKTDFSIVYRNYSKSFTALQTNGFGENGTTWNEEGIYSGFSLKINNNLSLLGYYDIFKSPWLKFNTNAPSRGADLWAEIRFKPNKKFIAYYRYRSEGKQGNTLDNKLIIIQTNTIIRHRIHSEYHITKSIELRNRIEWNSNQGGSNISYGSLLYQDIIYKPFGKKFHINGRIAYSKIDAFNNRIYSFEQVPLYDYPMHVHSYNGLRFNLTTRYKLNSNLDIWLRFAFSKYESPLNSFSDDFTIGSGLEEINGTLKNTYTAQVRYKIK